jgi:hypothetical protein
MKSSTVPGLLRVTFSDNLSPLTLQKIHTGGLAAEIPADLRELLIAAGCIEISGVYHLKPEEVYNDKYGFAREFKVVLKAGCDVERSIQTLTASPLVESIQAVEFRHSKRT